MAEGHRGRLALIGLAALSLAVGIWTGLVRIGLLSEPAAGLPLEHHATLMVSGFLGTLIGIERAAACDARWAWSAPALSGLGTVALLIGAPDVVGHGLVLAAAVVLTGIMVALWKRQPGLATGVMAVAPLGWVAGNVVLLSGRPLHDAVLSWGAFLILTIAGERLILSRLTRTPPLATVAFTAGCAMTLAGALPAMDGAGAVIAGAGWLLLAAWLLRFDVARRRTGIPGLPRFVATALLAGYAWLGVSGVLLLSQGVDPLARELRLPVLGATGIAALPYDAILHALFLGFVLSMIFAHAPIVLPAVLGRPVRWRRRFWVHLLLLHGSVAARVGADLVGAVEARSWAGLASALAIGVFGVSTAAVVVRPAAGKVRPPRREPAGGRPAPRPASIPGSDPAVGEADSATGPVREAARG